MIDAFSGWCGCGFSLRWACLGLGGGGFLVVLVCVYCGRLAVGITDFLGILVSCGLGNIVRNLILVVLAVLWFVLLVFCCLGFSGCLVW